MRQSLLDQEADIRKKLAKNYQEALKEVKSRILKMAEDPEFKGEKAMQAKYLLMLEAQLETILHKLLYPQLGVKLCSMAGGGVQKSIWCF